MTKPKFQRPIFCPCYTLDSALQTVGGIKGKWLERSRVGVYLGRSPSHARSVALVLNIDTGRVSPQYHVQFDPSYQTIRKSFGGTAPHSSWQRICGFFKASKRKKRSKGKTTSTSDLLQKGTYLEPLVTQPLPEPEIVAPTAEDPSEPTPSESQEQRDESTAESTSHSEGARDPSPQVSIQIQVSADHPGSLHRSLATD